LVAENVIGRQTDGEEVGTGACSQLLVIDHVLRKLELVLVRERSGADHLIESRIRAVLRLSMGGGAEGVAVAITPIPVPVFAGAIAGIEISCPLGKVVAVITRCLPCARLMVDPVGSVGGITGRQNRCA